MRQRQGRAAFAFNATLSVVLLGVIAAIALVVKPPTPPGIAEFAPQATKPITKAPQDQSATNGEGQGGCAEGQKCVVPSSSPKPAVVAPQDPIIGVPSALQCYTWPDGSVTQTFDAQSPPCVANWPEKDKGNGGDTTQGVTSSAIRVAFAQTAGADYSKRLAPLVDFFNSHYQLYGRKIQLVPFNSNQAQRAVSEGTVAYSDPQSQKADAVQASALKPFAAMDFVLPEPFVFTSRTYIDTLAQKKVISLTGGEAPALASAQDLARNHPYAWSFLPTTTDLLVNTAEMICKQLVGKRATHSTAMAAKVRKFAVLVPDEGFTGGKLAGLDELLAGLASCGVKPRLVHYNAQDTGAGGPLNASMVQLRTENVTSLIYFSYYSAGNPGSPQNTASRNNYSPEWIVPGWGAWGVATLHSGNAQQLANSFGIGGWNKVLPLNATPWYQAYTATGGDPVEASKLRGGGTIYRELAMLAAGVQMAGARLTPQTFATALASTDFPNPGSGEAPSFQANVAFGTGHSMVSDYSAFWFADKYDQAQLLAEGPAFNPSGAFCYAGRGLRWGRGQWTDQDLFKRGTCR